MQQTIWVWTWDPTILIGIAVWTVGYVFLIGPLRRRKGWEPAISPTRQMLFHLGTLITFFALVSPLDHISDDFLLSAHMFQHLLLIMVAPPLWLLGFPANWLDPIIPKGWFSTLLRALTRPIPAFIIFNGVFLVWHIPALYTAALDHEAIHAFEHLSFIAAAFIGWWPVLGFLPKTAPRPSFAMQMGYCFGLMIPTTILAAIISFANSLIYPFYQDAPTVIRTSLVTAQAGGTRLWGISALQDQQISGLMMWVPANMAYFLAFMVTFNRWFQVNEHHDREKYQLEDQAQAANAVAEKEATTENPVELPSPR